MSIFCDLRADLMKLGPFLLSYAPPVGDDLLLRAIVYNCADSFESNMGRPLKNLRNATKDLQAWNIWVVKLKLVYKNRNGNGTGAGGSHDFVWILGERMSSTATQHFRSHVPIL